MSILSVLFFIPFCRFRGNNRFEGERFPTEEVVIVFSLCHINCMKILTTIIYLFHIKTFYTKILAFFTPFFIATNIANKPLSDCITSLKTILLFHFSPKPTAEGETKWQQSKQLQFHKITRKKRTYVALLLSDANRTFLPTSLNSSPGANCQICLLFTENVTNPKNPKAFKMHPQPNKLFQTYQNQLIFRLQVVTTLFKISVNHSTSAWVKFISILLDNTISFYYFAPLSSCSAQKLF